MARRVQFESFGGRRLCPAQISDYEITPERVEIGYRVYGAGRIVFEIVDEPRRTWAEQKLIDIFETPEQPPVTVPPATPVRRPRGRPPKIKLPDKAV